MVFSSLTFIYVFLPLSLLFHYLSKNTLYRNLTLTIFSLVFYAWGEPMWIILLLISSFYDYFNGILVERFLGTWKAKLFLILSVVGNLGILLAYKYGGFIWENIDGMLQNFNMLFNTSMETPFAKPTNSLPIGISFYTFQTISYVVDVYRGQVKAQRNPLNFLMFVSLFHQLMAGPIVRYATIAAQIENRKVNWEMISSGVGRFCFGLFKKVVVANIASELVDKYMIYTYHGDGNFDLSSYEAWFGIIMFSVQIYFDFSGYSDMAIGLGKMYGFTYDENFKHPYAAQSVGDFYRRWHISLGTFLRDYVYFPLGGGRKNRYRNILIVWLLTGFWHGASWNFVFWGLYFGCFMVIEKLLENVLKKTPRIIRHAYTLFLIVFSRALFYFDSLYLSNKHFENADFKNESEWSPMFGYIANLFNSSNPVNPAFMADLVMHLYFFILVLILCIPWDEIFTEQHTVRIKTERIYFYTKPIVNFAMLAIATTLLINATHNPFIYFRF